ncbi:MAG: response regulator transcription factor [Elusimicrobiota bacterium]
MSGPQKTIVVIEDDTRVRDMTRDALQSEGYYVLDTDRLETGWHLIQQRLPDLVVLDLGLPDGSGLDLLGKIRTNPRFSGLPVIVLTAQGDLESKDRGFATGADQYLAKPLSAHELLLWVRALLRRVRMDKGEDRLIQVGDLVVDVAAHVIRYKGTDIPDLTPREFEIFSYLVRKRPQVLSRKHILSILWHTVAVDNLVDTHISNLRRKLPCGLSDRIQTVPGKGFRFLP